MNRNRTFGAASAGAAEGQQDEAAGQPEAHETSVEQLEEEAWEEAPARPRLRWLVPALTVLAALGWTGFFGWVNQGAILAGASAPQWLDWIVQWSVPLVLLAALYLIAMRNSRREANRFTDAARALSVESAQLETRLKVVNRELALAREFIEAQSRDLETLGRIASERLSTNAEHLQSLIQSNSAQVEAIGHVSETAVGNMEMLRDQLPVLANSARDMNNQLGAAGQNAQGQVASLVAAFERLNTFGAAGEAHVASVNEQVEATLRGFEEQLVTLGDLAGQRFERLRTQSDEFRRELESSEERVIDAIATRSEALARQLHDDAEALRQREAAAASAMRERLVALRVEGERLVQGMDGGQAAATERWTAAITGIEERLRQVLEGVVRLDESATENARARLMALNEEAQQVDRRLADSMAAFESEFATRRAATQASEAEALATLEARIAEFDARNTERQQEHLAHVAGLAERGEALAGRLAALDGDMQALGSQAAAASGTMAEAADVLANRLSQSRAVLEESGTFINRLTDDGVRLLEIIRASAEHSEGALSNSVAKAENRLAAFSSTAEGLQQLIGDAEARGVNLAAQIETARTSGTASIEQLRELEGQLAQVNSEAEAISRRASQDLRQAIDALSETSTTVLANLRDEQAGAVAALAEELAAASRDRLTEAMRRHAAETIEQIAAASSRADATARETTRLLRNQLAEVGELAASLEQRVEYARERAEQKVESDFTRRMALITEALHSTAIDITKVFDNDVTDVQWANYLRGDRGIFTRRAVSLLDKREARQVSDVYQEDSEFRDTVNRYIHDFEAMLRNVLATRDGNAMAVTLLSSDVGKLYVALAQAIERLRD
ncbi:MAG: hypothetical protein KDE15_02510 [Erythrobacter sp.]|nr:hypothetical protein [Erythrobacter sp.]